MNKYFRALILAVMISFVFSSSVFAAGIDKAEISISVGNDNTLHITTANKDFWNVPYIVQNNRILLNASTIESIINESEGSNVCTISDLCSFDAPKTIVDYKALEIEYIADIDVALIRPGSEQSREVKMDCSPVWSRIWNKPTDTNKYPEQTFYNNGSMYLPLRYTFEQLGFSVNWNGRDKSIKIG